MLSQEIISPPISSAAETASELLPLAVGPAMMTISFLSIYIILTLYDALEQLVEVCARKSDDRGSAMGTLQRKPFIHSGKELADLNV